MEYTHRGWMKLQEENAFKKHLEKRKRFSMGIAISLLVIFSVAARIYVSAPVLAVDGAGKPQYIDRGEQQKVYPTDRGFARLLAFCAPPSVRVK